MRHWIKLNFTKHEIWALYWAKKLPIFALFFAESLCVWGFIPVLVATPIILVLMDYSPLLFAIVGLPVGLLFTLAPAPWFFRWYFICVGLMFGKTKMADSKQAELRKRLEALT